MKRTSTIVCLFVLLVLNIHVIVAQSFPPSIVWQKSFGGSSEETLKSMIVTSDSGFILLGTTLSNNGDVNGYHGGYDIWIVKINSSGTIEWQRCLGGNGNEVANSIIQTPDSGFLVTGTTSSNNGDATGNHGSIDGFVTKLSSTGVVQWNKCLGGSADEEITVALVTKASNYLFGGTTRSNNGDVNGFHGVVDIWVVELSINGNINWQRCYGGSSVEKFNGITEIESGGFFIYGSTNSSDGDVNAVPQNGNDAWLIRTNQSGIIGWHKLFSGNYQNAFTFDDRSLAVIRSENNYLFFYSFLLERPLIRGNFRLIYSTYVSRLDSTTGDLLDNTLLTPSSVYNQFDESSWLNPRSIRPREGGGFLIVNNVNTCIEWDDYLFTFPPRTPFAYMGLPGNAVDLRPTCPTGYLPYVIRHGSYRTYDVDQYNVTDNIYVGSSDADNRPAQQQLGSLDGLINIGKLPPSYWGGSNSDEFTSVISIDENNFIVGGNSSSNNGHVSGNHGGVDIWIVRFKIIKNTIKGTVYLDLNSNNNRDPGEIQLNNQLVKSSDQHDSVISNTVNGLFNNIVERDEVYSTSVLFNNPHYQLTPLIKISNFTGGTTTDSFNVAVAPIPGKKDLQVYAYALSTPLPGSEINYLLNYMNTGTDSLSNTQLVFIKDSRTIFVGATRPEFEIKGDTILWNTGTLAPLASENIRVDLRVAASPLITTTDTLLFRTSVYPMEGDETALDNSINTRTIVKGIDVSNTISNQHGGIIGKAYLQRGGYMYYIIRFQNPGNNTVITVNVNSELSSELDQNSIEMLGSSHPYRLLIKNNIADWKFENILLPGSNIDPEASRGYLMFRIKPSISAISTGKMFIANARIQFDANQVIQTTLDFLRVISVAQPTLTGLENRYCKNSMSTVTLKLMNPPLTDNILILLDTIHPIVFNWTDSSIRIDISNLSADFYHQIRVIYSSPEKGADSILNYFWTDDYRQVNILNSDSGICILSSPVTLNANTNVLWWGPGVTTNQFYPLTAGPGVHSIIATRMNGACPISSDTLRLTVLSMADPIVKLQSSSGSINSPTDRIILRTSNRSGGGASPTYQFAKDKNFINLLGAESRDSVFEITPRLLQYGDNWIYVRMRTSEICFDNQFSTDSVLLKLMITTPGNNELDPFIKIFPNPSKGLFRFIIETGINDQVRILISDINGRNIAGIDYGVINQYDFSMEINLTKNLNGPYIVVFHIGSQTLKRKILIAR